MKGCKRIFRYQFSPETFGYTLVGAQDGTGGTLCAYEVDKIIVISGEGLGPIIFPLGPFISESLKTYWKESHIRNEHLP